MGILNRDRYIACKNGDMEELKFFETWADFTERDNLAVIIASSYGQIKTVKFLMKHNADITARDNSPVYWASKKGYLEMVRFLLEHGADFNVLTDEHKDYFKTIKWFRTPLA